MPDDDRKPQEVHVAGTVNVVRERQKWDYQWHSNTEEAQLDQLGGQGFEAVCLLTRKVDGVLKEGVLFKRPA